MRHEYKHLINKADDMVLSARLQKLFPYDKHADSHGRYRVSSMYFDTPDDKALRQKLDGVNQREKFRLRYYNDDTSFIRLEKKIKIGGLCAKYTAPLSRQQAEQLMNGEYSFLLQSDNALFIELYSKIKGQLLRPTVAVRYEREAFLYEAGNVRVTLDRKLQTGLRHMDFFDPVFPHVDIFDIMTVLEVKYDAYLPDVVRLAVQTPNRRAAAYSKYAAARRYD